MDTQPNPVDECGHAARSLAGALSAENGPPAERARQAEARSALDWLCRATGAIAAGCWRCEGESLILVAFSARNEMPLDVQQAFQEATAHVRLDQTALAIVQAVHARRTVTAEPPPAGETGQGSPAWLRRFAARQSAAVPVIAGGRVVAALAVASTRLFEAREIALIEAVAGGLGHLHPTAMGHTE